MQFIVIAYDGTDAGALDRRLSVREAHMEQAQQMYKDGRLLFAVAVLDERERMIGSTMIVDFPSEEAMQEQWLNREPYVLGDVWRDIQVCPCKTPGFIQLSSEIAMG